MSIRNYSPKTAPTAISKEQKSPKAKRIVLGVDVHLKSYRAASKTDNGAIGAVAKFRRGTGHSAHYYRGSLANYPLSAPVPAGAKMAGSLEGYQRALKKKAVVAIGRQLMVDLWRLQTGRITAPELNLVLIGG
jgi:hypothetical protein